MSEISDKQLEANRQNSKLGGVKTEDGKEVSKMNAVKHGLLCQQALLEEEDAEELAELELSVRRRLLPDDGLELYLVDRMVANIWRLRRLIKIEGSIMEYEKNGPLALNIFDHGKQKEDCKRVDMFRSELIERIMRYEASIDRGTYRALHELQLLQTIRRGEQANIPVSLGTGEKEGE